VLRKDGYRFDRPGKGDHELWFSPISNRRFVVDSKIKSRHMANAVPAHPHCVAMPKLQTLLLGALLVLASACNTTPDAPPPQVCNCVGSCRLPDDFPLDIGDDGVLGVVNQRVGSESECAQLTARACADEELPVFASVCNPPATRPLPEEACECAGFCDGPAGVTLRVAGPMASGNLCALATGSVCAGRGEAVIEARCDEITRDETSCLCQGACEAGEGVRVVVAENTRSAIGCLRITTDRCGSANVASANCLAD